MDQITYRYVIANSQLERIQHKTEPVTSPTCLMSVLVGKRTSGHVYAVPLGKPQRTGFQYRPIRAKAQNWGAIFGTLDEVKRSIEGDDREWTDITGTDKDPFKDFVKGDYSQTYWNNKGKHSDLLAEVNKLVPAQDEVPNHEQNPALEKFRIASNCYYDLYNNGGGNLIEQFEDTFGFEGPCTKNTSEHSLKAFDRDEEWWTQENIDKVERKMDEIIVNAAHEQHIGEKAEPVFIDLTPQSLKTPEGAKRVKQAQDDFDEARENVARVATSIRTTLYAIRSACSDKSISSRLREYFSPDDLIGLIEAIEERMRAEEAFVRAVAGR